MRARPADGEAGRPARQARDGHGHGAEAEHRLLSGRGTAGHGRAFARFHVGLCLPCALPGARPRAACSSSTRGTARRAGCATGWRSKKTSSAEERQSRARDAASQQKGGQG